MSSAESIAGFRELGIAEPLIRALEELGYEEPTPIQMASIPALLEGRDVIGSAATGTGKTAAFALPIVQSIETERKDVQALILAPTRELAVQVAEAVHRYGRFRGVTVLPVYGGQSIDRQLTGLRRGVHVVVGTPGRILDHIRRRSLDLSTVRNVVLDEADEMLDMGFIEDIEAILGETPSERQTALFSATFPPSIRQLARRHLRDPLTVAVRPQAMETPQVRQVAYIVPKHHKLEALARILDLESPNSAIIFCRTRTEVDELTEALALRGYRPEALHGGLNQAQRDRVMGRFRDGVADLLIATDVAARGLDVEHVSHVINFNIPQSPEAYVHRIGRTGRAGRAGVAISLIQPREHRLLKAIEREVRQRIEPARIPTMADLRARRLELLHDDLHETLLDGDFERYRDVIETLSEEFDLLDIAAAAAKLALSASHGDDVPEDVADLPQWQPQDDRDADRGGRGPRKHRERVDGQDGGRGRGRRGVGPSSRIFVGMGRRRDLRAGDLVGAIVNEAGIPASAIGSIEIADQFSLVEIADELVDQVIRALSRASLKGRKVAVRRSKD